jgi:hypothetical protein
MTHGTPATTMKLPGLVPNGKRQPSCSLRTLRELRDEPPAAPALQARCDRTSSSVQHEGWTSSPARGQLTQDAAGAQPAHRTGSRARAGAGIPRRPGAELTGHAAEPAADPPTRPARNKSTDMPSLR